MPQVIATWDDFSGGHWGNLGPSDADPDMFGGVNMIGVDDGSLAPATSSRHLRLNANPIGKLWGMYWGWGADGNVYFITSPAATTITNTCYLYRFDPNPTSLPITLTTVSTFTTRFLTEPDWVTNRTNIYFTVYGDKCYEIRGTIPDLIPIIGPSPGGKCIAIYKDRIFVGNINDVTHGVKANRIHFSGSDTTNDTENGAVWEATNFFDLGGVRNNENSPTLAIMGLFPMRDYLVAICDDQQIFLISGTPNLDLTVRRAYGFHKGSGGLTAFTPRHGAVDPGQVRTWFYDHTIRAPVRFNGASITRIERFGVPNQDRAGTAVVEGCMGALSGPDEFICEGVAVGRAAGEQTASHRLVLLRVNEIYSLVTNDVIAARS